MFYENLKINIESSPPEIWRSIHFHNGSGYPSLNTPPKITQRQ